MIDYTTINGPLDSIKVINFDFDFSFFCNNKPGGKCNGVFQKDYGHLFNYTLPDTYQDKLEIDTKFKFTASVLVPQFFISSIFGDYT